MIEAIIYLLLITIAEVITVFLMELSPLWGIVAHIVILILVIVHSAVETRYPHRPLLLSLALVPLVRIISLCMPLANIPQIWQYPIIYAPLLVAAVVVMRILNYRPEQVGLTSRWLPVQLAVALTGFGFGVVEYLILAPEAMVTELTWQAMWLPSLMFLVCTGFVEEFIFRGVLQRSAVEEFGGWWIVYVSLLFAILHLGHYPANPPYSYWDVLFVFVIALFFGWVVKKTGSLLGVTLSHGITNIVLYLVAPFFLG